jgi:hypothetical protein
MLLIANRKTFNCKPIFTDIPQGNFHVQLQEGEEQTIQTALTYAKAGFEQLGYEVVID